MARKKKTTKPVILEDGTLQVYSYHPATGLYVGTDVAFTDPLTPGEYLIPASATPIEPPTPGEGELVRWNGSEWVKEPIPVIEPEPAPEPTEEQKAAEARAQRNGLLLACDWTQLPDVPLSAEVKADWVEYRQSLRDVPQQEDFPTTIIWPEKP